MTDRGDQIAVAARLDSQHAETGFLAVEGHPLDKTGQDLMALITGSDECRRRLPHALTFLFHVHHAPDQRRFARWSSHPPLRHWPDDDLLLLCQDLRGLTQAALVEKAVLNHVTIAEIETARKQGSVASLRTLADAFGVTLDDLTVQGRPIAGVHHTRPA